MRFVPASRVPQRVRKACFTMLWVGIFAIGCSSSPPRESERTETQEAQAPKSQTPKAQTPEREPPAAVTDTTSAGDPPTEESVAAAPLGILFESFTADPIARWLVSYDRVAWASTDLLLEQPEEELAKLTPEWFCYEDDGGWHAVFGHYDPESDQYDALHHFRVDDQFVARAVSEPVPAERALPSARAIRASRPLLEAELSNLRLRMNTYVRASEESLEVWYLPAMLDDGRCIAGGEFCFRFDREGKKLLGKEIVRTKFLAFTPGPEARIILSDPGRSSPSMGNLFFAYSHFERFDSIKIETDRHLSLLGKFDGEFSWIHLEKEGSEEGAPEKE